MRNGQWGVQVRACWIGCCALALAVLSCVSAKPVLLGRSVVLPAEQLEEVRWLCSRPGPQVEGVEATYDPETRRFSQLAVNGEA